MITSDCFLWALGGRGRGVLFEEWKGQRSELLTP